MELIIPHIAKQIIQREVPYVIRRELLSLVSRGYKLASQARNNVLFLDWGLGWRHEGYLRPIAIGYLLKQEIDKGTLPFSYSLEFNKNKSHLYLVIHTKKAKITISQVDNSRQVPRPSYFRNKLQEANQIRFKLFNDEAIPTIDDEFYLLLTFSSGGESPRFINLGLPSGNGWIDKINLLTEPHLKENETELTKEEHILEEQLVGLRQFIQEVGESAN